MTHACFRILKRITNLILNAAFIVALVFVIARVFLYTPFVIPSESMMPTLNVGDRLIGLTIDKTYEVGDIVTFTNPENKSETLIKRIVATEGETVQFANDQLIVDGRPREFEQSIGRSYPLSEHASTLDQSLTYPITVPEGSIFVMGDNRENSADSRYLGCIPTSTITSKIAWRYWPLERTGDVS